MNNNPSDYDEAKVEQQNERIKDDQRHQEGEQ